MDFWNCRLTKSWFPRIFQIMLDSGIEFQQFRIPIYQRTYDWETENCQQLLDDIIKVANDENRPTHFFGSISNIFVFQLIFRKCHLKILISNREQSVNTNAYNFDQ